MADTFIQVATDGSGKKLDTRTEGTNAEHRQVVVLGDPATNAAVAPVSATTGLSVNVTNATQAATQSGTWTVQPGNTANTTAWKVDASSVAVPITDNAGSLTVDNGGTFATQAAQSGTWTVQPGNTANTTAWKVDGSAVYDFGSGTSGTKTQRVIIDSGQLGSLGQTTMAASQPVTVASDQSSVKTVSGGNEWETVAASQTGQALGATGATGDYLEGLVCVVSTAATSQVQIADGAGSAFTVLPNAVGAGVGTYYVPLGLKSLAGAWKVTTAAGVAVIGIGDFT